MQTNCCDSDSEGISELSRSDGPSGDLGASSGKKKLMLRLTWPDRLRQHRIDALTAIDDEGSFSCYRFKSIMMTGIAFLTDASIDLAFAIVGHEMELMVMELMVIVVAVVVAMSLVTFDLDVYIIGALVVWRFIVTGQDYLRVVLSAAAPSPQRAFLAVSCRRSDSLVWGAQGGVREYQTGEDGEEEKGAG
ncbi:hypothetical protein BGY98DRAFT_1173167 [Russula aff. rugulosa BPL654]|nr:hypothetical protein BGY98DRAFT_1173167 [Russula aff. rugulosa BPL654]